MTTTFPDRSPALGAAPGDVVVDPAGLPGDRRIERTVAAAAVILVAFSRFTIGPDIMPRHAAALILVPVWLFALRHWRGARLLLLVAIASAVAGIALAIGSDQQYIVSTTSMVKQIMLVGGVAAGVGVILWSRRIIGDKQVGLYFALGLLVNGLVNAGTLGASNPLKFAFALPIAIGVLSLLDARKLGTHLVALLALGGLAIVSDARSLFGMTIAAAALVLWQMRPTRISRVKSWVSTALLLALTALLVYYIASALLVGGFLGAEAQARSVAQLGAAGSLILGGRPEIAATAALMLNHPFGFGYGVSVSHAELQAAKSGMAAINYDPNNGYVESYMFGNHVIELHSVVGDLWAASGLVGLALVAVILWQVIRNTSLQIVQRRASGLMLFLASLTIWNMFFSPLYSAAPSLILALGLLLPAYGAPEPDLPGEPVDRSEY